MTYIQEYLIHMANGDTIVAVEPYDLKGPETLIDRYERAKPDDLFCVGDALIGFAYFPARSIVYINTGRVKRCDRETYDYVKKVKARGNKDQ